MFKPLLVSTLLVGMFAMTPAAEASSVSIDLMPGVTLNIGDRDRRGYYWDGYDWRSERWWREHRGYHHGERNRHGYYWDGWRWRDVGWWREHNRGPRHFDRGPRDFDRHHAHRDSRRGPGPGWDDRRGPDRH
ncbi:DUF2502 domain-containing protein [Brenneria izadpanahii]|uniref:DUF2502 domain-containing protein n=1 Tax=Brenneria izadpanahii TaxID=2722756 RepID=A0ABX7UPN6_9GAMM|nr:DUF2502 domain-containing protein [Brenneria izadpanahii]QTF07245.1 DUF2502 domain-containing protein [Brenneria izadpanahii]